MAVQRFGRSGVTGDLLETRHLRAALKAQFNKTDRNDARGSKALWIGGRS
jgi:hypothetical protein